MVLASPVPGDQLPYPLLIKYSPAGSSMAQQVLFGDSGVAASEPCAEWNRKAHLPSIEYFARQPTLHCSAQDVFGSQASKFHVCGHQAGKLDQVVIKERNSALYGGS